MKKYIFLLFLFTAGTIAAQEVLDKVVAVVGDEIILRSELEFRINVLASKRNIDPQNEDVKKSVLQEMIGEKLLYAQAELDSIEVSDQEINQQLDYQMNYFIQQLGSEERVEQMYGMSIERIKRELREDVRKNLMTQRVQQQKFAQIDVSRKDVEDFFTQYKDSLGLIPEKYTISHIFINPNEGEQVKKKAREFASALLDSIKAGKDFAQLAKEYSDDPGSARLGGDLGFVKRGLFYPEFEAAAFALKPGQISGIVESPVGYHIIELLERRGESIHTRHILIKVKSDDKTDLNAITFLTQLRDSVLSGDSTFSYYAKKYSDDKETAPRGGELGVYELNQLDKNLKNQVVNLSEGEISFPKRLDVGGGNYGFHIVRLDKKVPAHNPSLERDYDEIKRIAQFRKRQELYVDWIEEIKDNVYWEVKI